jgi:hypothetical protein
MSGELQLQDFISRGIGNYIVEFTLGLVILTCVVVLTVSFSCMKGAYYHAIYEIVIDEVFGWNVK